MTARHLFENPEIRPSDISSEHFIRLLEMQSNLLGIAAATHETQGLTEKLCLLAEQLEPESVASIMLRNEADGKMYVHAGPSLPTEAIDALNGLDVGSGSCGNVVAHDEEMYVCNTMEDRRWDNVREFAVQFNVMACWAAPVRNDINEVIGSFALSSFQRREPNAFQKTLLKICASIAGILIQKEKYQQRNREWETEVLKLQKLESIGVLAGGIAHDFNNLLGIITGNIDMALRGVNENSKMHHFLSSAEKAASNAIHLTGQLLTFSKGGIPVKKPSNIRQIVRESADFVLHGSNVNLKFNCQCNNCNRNGMEWVAEVDNGQISQVIQNLVINARQAMTDRGAITVRCNLVNHAEGDTKNIIKPGAYFKIDIEDTGPGIEEDIIDKIFDPYFTTKPNGNGLGLAITHAIVRKHGGHILADSTGDGARFTVYLPATSNPSKHEIRNVIDINKLQVRHKGRVLVVDDQEMLREVARAMLEDLGYEVVEAEEGRHAVEIYKISLDRNDPIDLTIMDLTMPKGMDGKDATRRILSINPDAKIVVCSGYSTDSAMSNYSDYGFQAAISKPYKLEELDETLSAVMWR